MKGLISVFPSHLETLQEQKCTLTFYGDDRNLPKLTTPEDDRVMTRIIIMQISCNFKYTCDSDCDVILWCSSSDRLRRTEGLE
ncbi:hypothetical protein NPIL_527711 [Nephila pilipes]|uniref:Uncharacterized protein n=1 Tax=Nephila pilipes TaxID=299642 RepID=A0A8X6PA40_NEPPI|nr:hypothetical protein NPIL_527711 [Nephila pilipes]